MSEPQEAAPVSEEALAAIRSWYALEVAMKDASKKMRSDYGVTGEQVAICRIVSEKERWALSELKRRLTMHPATLGQALSRLEEKGLIAILSDSLDGRRREVAITTSGKELLENIPLVGPVRLRRVEVPSDDLVKLDWAFRRARELFGLDQ